MPGAVAIGPLPRPRDRLTASGRRRADIAKKENLYWGARRWRANGQNKFPKSV
jgi:hypothetical protein